MLLTKAFRSQKLLDAARDQPCVLCGSTGTTVAAHANSVALGKGMGVKASDCYTAWVCAYHHDLIDGRTGRLSHDEQWGLWSQAHLLTVRRWFEEGIVKVC